MLNYINMRIHGKQEQVPNFIKNYFLLREISYKLIMVCLRLKKKSMINHMDGISTT